MKSTRPVLSLAAGAVLLLATPLTATADDGGRPIAVEMTGAQEAPGPGDPDGSGTATFALNVGQGEICYTLAVADIAPATAAHIHLAPVGVPGPVVVPLVPPTSGSSAGCADVDRALVKAILKSPEDYYVNVHNNDFQPGAVRGQLG
ncbi:MAG: CHRD domain-containing protein [Nocardioidaceae bacterium]